MTLASRTPALIGRHVELVPIEPGFAAGLADAAAIDRSTYGYTVVPDGLEDATRFVAGQIGERDAGLTVPFAHRLPGTGRLVGCTRFLNLVWWSDRDDPAAVEIGGTWLAADVQRSPVNTEAKLLQLTHAFETWGVFRVQLATDVRNDRSRTALVRLGAVFEGILRNDRESRTPGEVGRPRTSAMFSITDEEWPAVKRHLLDRLPGA